MEKLYAAEAISARVRELGSAIRKDAGDSPLLLLCILKGAAVFLADLVRAIPGDVRFEFLDKVQDIADTEIADATEIDFFSHCELRDRNVYLLKDVVSTGVIESYLIAQLKLRGPTSLKLVALLDRPELRTVPLDADFSAFVVGKGTFVGYGLEHNGQFGNLDYIAAL